MNLGPYRSPPQASKRIRTFHWGFYAAPLAGVLLVALRFKVVEGLSTAEIVGYSAISLPIFVLLIRFDRRLWP
jgi:hypothetical protein